MVYVLYILFFISCLILVISVLLQPGKTDAGALFTSNISSTAFGPRGTTTILAKITIGAAVLFFLSALLLSIPAITGEVSVLQKVETKENIVEQERERDSSTEKQEEIEKKEESKEKER